MTSSDFRRVRVQSLIESGILAINDGYRVKNSELGPVGIPFVRGGDIGDGWIETNVADHIRPEFAGRVTPKLTQPGDVAFITKGTVGRVGRIHEGQPAVVLAPQVAYWRSLDESKLNSRFLFYLLRSGEFQGNLDAVKTHGSMVADYVSLTDQRIFQLTLPPIHQQERIADILGTLDDKIELNRRMNETMEAMARRLFKSWFVDFDPIHAKTTRRHQHPKLSNADLSRRALPNMAPEIAELFPDSFEDSPIGPIPKGWKLGTVPDAIEINPTRSLAKGTIAPWLEMANMPTRSARALAWEHRAFGSGTKFINGDTLVARITPCLENGKTAYVDFLEDGEVAGGSTEYIVLRPKPPLSPVFGYLLARTDDFRQHLITNMTGTSGRQRAPADSLKSFPLVSPTKAIAERFAEATAAPFAQMKTIDEESAALTATRDKLLPRLLSGVLSVGGEVA